MPAALLLLLQLQGVVDTAHYSSQAVRELVERATMANAAPPAAVGRFGALVETEIAIGMRDSLGIERTTQVEQIATRVEWKGERYDQRIIGYRSQAIGTSISVLSFARGWTVPSLHGTVLHSGLATDTARRSSGRRSSRSRTPSAIHPLSADGSRAYAYRGGDTVTVIRARDRDVPIVRLVVSPRPATGDTAVLFDGEIDLDATRGEIVRMRGKFVRVDPENRAGGATARRLGAMAVAFIEFVNVEIDGRVWLPAHQRTEIHGSFVGTGDARSVLRVVSRFRDHVVEPAGDTAAPPLAYRRHLLIFGPRDSLSAYDDWTAPIGEASRSVAAADFDDLSPDAWSGAGPPRVRVRARRPGDVIRFNRIEGLYTGAAAELDMRDAAPGMTISGNAGWAWWERTVRGELGMRNVRPRWTTSARLARSLVTTNDFTRSSGTSLVGGVLGVDDHDYVDRWSASAGVLRSVDDRSRSWVRLELGPVADRAVRRNVSRGLLADTTFRENRGVREWEYLRIVATAALRSDVTGTYLQPGLGATLNWERGQGSSSYDRLEAVILARQRQGRLTLVGRASGGVVVGDVPPQALFELGGGTNLPGYRYKEFAGDAAAAGRLLALFGFGLLDAPIQVTRRYVLPAPSPGVAAGMTAGWTRLRSASSRQAAELLLGAPARDTRAVLATADLRLTFFNGATSFGVARPLNRGRWRLVVDFAQPF